MNKIIITQNCQTFIAWNLYLWIMSLYFWQVHLILLVTLAPSLSHSSNNANRFSFTYINRSLSTRHIAEQFSECSVHPIFKKSNLDKENVFNYSQFHTVLAFPNSQKERLVKNNLINCQNETISRTPSSLPTLNSIRLKPLDLLYMTTSSEPWVWASSSFLLPSTLSTILFFYNDSNLGFD